MSDQDVEDVIAAVKDIVKHYHLSVSHAVI